MTTVVTNTLGTLDQPDALTPEALTAPPPGGGGKAPHPPSHPPSHRGKKLGMYVKMAPIPGMTPAGVFLGAKPYHFQCPPTDQFQESSAFTFQDYGTISGGQHSQRVGRQLRSVQFNTIIMDTDPEWALARDGSGRYPAQKALHQLRAICEAGHPFRLTVHQLIQDKCECDYAATLRSVVWTLQPGEIDAYYVTVQFTEFNTPDIQEFLAGKDTHAHLPAVLNVKTLPSNKNTLHKLAKFYYGDPAKARVIAVYNHITGIPFSEVLTEKNVRKKKITVPVLKKAQR